MTALLNHTAIPFFERIPARGHKLLLETFDGIVDKSWNLKEAHHLFSSSLKIKGIDAPTLGEFTDWYSRVRNGLIERPHPSEALLDSVPKAASPYTYAFETRAREKHVQTNGAYKQPHAIPCTTEHPVEFDHLTHAKTIVRAAHALFESKQAAGYSPLSINLDDTIVSEALRTILEAEATATIMDADTHMTAGNKLVDLLLGTGDDEIDAKLVDCLTIDMQQELCRELVRNGATEGAAAMVKFPATRSSRRPHA